MVVSVPERARSAACSNRDKLLAKPVAMRVRALLVLQVHVLQVPWTNSLLLVPQPPTAIPVVSTVWVTARSVPTLAPFPETLIPRPASRSLRPQHVGNMLWAYGTLEQPAPTLVAVLLASLARRLPDFSAQVRCCAALFAGLGDWGRLRGCPCNVMGRPRHLGID